MTKPDGTEYEPHPPEEGGPTPGVCVLCKKPFRDKVAHPRELFMS